MNDEASQLQLFEMPATGTIRRAMAPARRLEIQQDHAILLSMAGLIGLAVIFAGGVERGKQRARVERALVAPSSPPSSSSTSSGEEPLDVVRNSSVSSDRVLESSGTPSSVTERKTPPTPKRDSAPRGPKRVVSTTSRFAVQVVSYSKPELAMRELKRLRAHGESAFLVKKQDKAVLFVGPFTSRQRANNKLVGLRPRYRDCFVRSL
jgi:hypothetical protein